MVLCVLRMDADRSDQMLLAALYCLTVVTMLATRWVYFLSALHDRHQNCGEWKHALGFSIMAIVLAAGVWTIAQTVSDAQTATNESSPSEIAAPMLSEGEMLTQTL